MFRAYKVDSGLVNITGSTATQLLAVTTTSTADCWLSIFRPTIEAVSSPAPPSNGSVYFQLSKTTGTLAGGAAVTPEICGAFTLAANSVWKSNSTTITGLTQSTGAGWAETVPFTAGAAWGDDRENTGFSVYCPPSTTLCFYFTAASGFGSGMAARMTVGFSE